MTGCCKVVRIERNYNSQYHIVFISHVVYIAVPITAFLTAVITTSIISSIVCIVTRKKAKKIEPTSQEEPDTIYDLPLPYQQAIELQINTAYDHINKQNAN